MKVKDLIHRLQQLDPNKYIVILGYETGADFPDAFNEVNITKDEHPNWFTGNLHFTHADNDEYNAYLLYSSLDKTNRTEWENSND